MINKKKFDRVMDICIIIVLSLTSTLVVGLTNAGAFDLMSFIKMSLTVFIINLLISLIIPAIKLGDMFAKRCGCKENTFAYALMNYLILTIIYVTGVDVIIIFINNSVLSDAISTFLRLYPLTLAVGYITSILFMPIAIKITHKILG